MNFSRYCILFVFAFTLSFLLCRFAIPILRKLGAGQNILSYVKEHENKSGTPTMGGIAFVISSLVATLIFTSRIDRTLLVTISIGSAYMFVGLLDDVLKKKHKQNLGLTVWQKVVFQVSVAAFASFYAVRAGLTEIRIPFFNKTLDLGGWMFPLSVFVFLATVNCVNLTDGLDGLAAGSCAPFFLFFGVLAALRGDDGSSVLCIALVGSLFAYLLFNSSPASVFMGDTGSLALGGFAVCIGVFGGDMLYIAIVGMAFVLSGASVIAQVTYFKMTKGKRIFKMTPIHHHFQQLGYSETKIAYAYFALTLIIGVVCLAFLI